MPRIMILDSDLNSAGSIKDNLEFNGYEAVVMSEPSEILPRILNESFDLIILETAVKIPDGNDIIREIRKTNKDILIIVLSSRIKEEDKVFALNLGADDYITKPFSMMELVARVRSHIRRLSLYRVSQNASTGIYPGYEPVNIRIGEATVYLDKMVAKTKENEQQLTPKEIGIIRLLHKNRGKVVSREMMMKEIWGDEVYITERVIDTNVVSIRKKIGDLGRKAKFIKTVFGVGYKMIEF
jgi:DNA-binding response OmpR family regulator